MKVEVWMQYFNRGLSRKRCIYFVHGRHSIRDWPIANRTNIVKISPKIEKGCAVMRLAIINALAKFQRAIISSSIGYGSSRFSLLNHLVGSEMKSAIRYRFTLQRNEVFQFPSACREMQVLSGVAWLTVAGKDLILTSKETASLASNKNVIISPLGNVPLVLEVL